MPYYPNKHTQKSYTHRTRVKKKKRKKSPDATCQKVKYYTTREAINALNRCKALANYQVNRDERRIYWCGECKAYHLTKQRRLGK